MEIWTRFTQKCKIGLLLTCGEFENIATGPHKLQAQTSLPQMSNKRPPVFGNMDSYTCQCGAMSFHFSDISCFEGSHRWESRGFEPLVGTVGPSASHPCMRTLLLLSNVPAAIIMGAGLLPIFTFLAGSIQLNAIRIASESGFFKQQNHHCIIAVRIRVNYLNNPETYYFSCRPL